MNKYRSLYKRITGKYDFISDKKLSLDAKRLKLKLDILINDKLLEIDYESINHKKNLLNNLNEAKDNIEKENKFFKKRIKENTVFSLIGLIMTVIVSIINSASISTFLIASILSYCGVFTVAAVADFLIYFKNTKAYKEFIKRNDDKNLLDDLEIEEERVMFATELQHSKRETLAKQDEKIAELSELSKSLLQLRKNISTAEIKAEKNLDINTSEKYMNKFFKKDQTVKSVLKRERKLNLGGRK